MIMQQLISSFPPVSDENARILILGSMPGRASLRAQQYYAHPRNHFWPIMGELTGAASALPYQERLKILMKNRIALWDVLQCCVRPGSLDSDITDETPNDFISFFAAHPSITHVFFNGQKAAQSFHSCFLSSRRDPDLRRNDIRALKNLSFTTLPSTSPANASWTFERKLTAWREVLRFSR